MRGEVFSLVVVVIVISVLAIIFAGLGQAQRPSETQITSDNVQLKNEENVMLPVTLTVNKAVIGDSYITYSHGRVLTITESAPMDMIVCVSVSSNIHCAGITRLRELLAGEPQ